MECGNRCCCRGGELRARQLPGYSRLRHDFGAWQRPLRNHRRRRQHAQPIHSGSPDSCQLQLQRSDADRPFCEAGPDRPGQPRRFSSSAGQHDSYAVSSIRHLPEYGVRAGSWFHLLLFALERHEHGHACSERSRRSVVAAERGIDSGPSESPADEDGLQRIRAIRGRARCRRKCLLSPVGRLRRRSGLSGHRGRPGEHRPGAFYRGQRRVAAGKLQLGHEHT